LACLTLRSWSACSTRKIQIVIEVGEKRGGSGITGGTSGCELLQDCLLSREVEGAKLGVGDLGLGLGLG